MCEKITPAVEKEELVVHKPSLWNGKAVTALYRLQGKIKKTEQVVERVELSIGFRQVAIDSNK